MAFLDETGLAEVWSLANAKFGHIVHGTYTGNGNYGSGNPNTLTLPFAPKMILIYRDNSSGSTFYPWGSQEWGIFAEGAILCANEYSGNAVGTSAYITEWGTTVKWYAGKAQDQANISGKKYHYVAIC